MAVKTKPKPDTAQLRANEKKWTKTLWDTGWTGIPNVILDQQRALGLTPTDLNILLQIAKYWWEAENVPFPSKDTLASAIGVQPRTIQRRVAGLEKKGLIHRERRKTAAGGDTSNRYVFTGLIEKATPHAEKALREKQKAIAAKKARQRRQKPFITLVKK